MLQEFEIYICLFVRHVPADERRRWLFIGAKIVLQEFILCSLTPFFECERCLGRLNRFIVFLGLVTLTILFRRLGEVLWGCNYDHQHLI